MLEDRVRDCEPLSWSRTRQSEYTSPCRIDQCLVRTRVRAQGLPSTDTRLLGWLADTFINSDDAEDALCGDRSAFLQSVQMKLIPRHIERCIVHIGDNAQIEGFRKLFEYLNAKPEADDLRQLVVNYFNDHPPLQPHLHEPLSRLSFRLILQ